MSNAESAIRLQAFAESIDGLMQDFHLKGLGLLSTVFQDAIVAYAAIALGITTQPKEVN